MVKSLKCSKNILQFKGNKGNKNKKAFLEFLWLSWEEYAIYDSLHLIYVIVEHL